jgi:hypothetical protein
VSSFLLNLARRAAGLPIGAVRAAAPAPFAGEPRAADPDAIGAVMELEAPPPELSAIAPVAAPTMGEVSAIPAIQRAPATTELAPISGLSAPPSGARPDRPTEADILAPATQFRRPAEPEPPVERAVPPVGAAVAGVESPAGSVPDLTARRPESPPGPVAAPVSAPDRARPIAAITAQVDEPRPPPIVRPATVEAPIPRQLPRPAPAAPPGAATPAPVHVHIGRIEVRGTPGPTPRTASSQGPAALGFAGYTRLRTYRSGWP